MDVKVLICGKCKIEKQEESFNKDKSNPRGRDYFCKECRRAEYEVDKINRAAGAKDRYERHKYNEKNRERIRKRKNEFILYKGGVCAMCGKMPHPAAMDFHHVDPNSKKFNIAHYYHKAYDGIKGEVKEELDKCILLCANCHRQLHAEETDKVC